MFETMTGAEFISTMYHDSCLYDGPQPMTLDDARYNLAEYKADGIPVPVTVTAKLFCDLWNLLYTRDTMKEGATVA